MQINFRKNFAEFREIAKKKRQLIDRQIIPSHQRSHNFAKKHNLQQWINTYKMFSKHSSKLNYLNGRDFRSYFI